ncbi:hypothetical protein B0H10DRAFT_1881741 [Mycena sp. CBHHK59/15]|nr:hypothetical protein B0H10DRAFT_1881741 [Mycena sp. CBHHK59/15]
MLVAEIDAAKLEDVPGLVTLLFPDDCLPMRPTDILAALSSSSGGSKPLYRISKWQGCPDLTVASKNGDAETMLVKFFHKFGERVADVCRAAGKTLPTENTEWTAQFATDSVPDAPNTRYPDLLLGIAGKRCRWVDIMIHGELKSSASGKTQSIVQLMNGAYLLFSSQDNRRFLISLSIIGYDIRVVIFDRAGMAVAKPFNIHQDPESFIRVLTGLMFANDPAVLGYDTTIKVTGAGRFIDVAGTQYKIIKTVFISDVIRGRGTVCWHVRHDGRDFVIKDIWADKSRPHTEAEILRMAQDVEGVPKVVADVVVQINGVDDSTKNLRSTIRGPEDGKTLFEAYSNVEERVHRRLVLTPYALSLTSFKSRKELISIFIDVVTAHRDLVAAKILHRDISMNNMMLVPSASDAIALPPTSPNLVALAEKHSVKRVPKCVQVDVDAPSSAVAPNTNHEFRRGILIDMDYALVLDYVGERKAATGHRTGTIPFMAIEILLDGNSQLAVHEPRHDLESFMYVLIWICLHYAGPCDVERQNFTILDSVFAAWVTGTDYRAIGVAKGYVIEKTKRWESEVLPTFAPYFEPLKPFVSAWRQLLVDERLTHEAVLDVLRQALRALPDVEDWSRKDDPEGFGDGGEGKKRKRQQHDYLGPINEKYDEDRPANVGRKTRRSAQSTDALSAQRPAAQAASEPEPAARGAALRPRIKKRERAPINRRPDIGST